LPPVQRLAPVAPLVVRVVVGLTMIAHGFHYGPVEFGLVAEQAFGVPFPMLIGWAVTLLLFGGGSLFVIGMLSRLVAIPSIVHLTLAAALWDVREGFAPVEGGGMQIPLLLIAGFLVVLLAGPGPVSLDSVLGWDNGWEQRPQAAAGSRARLALDSRRVN
jgi:uncharacterized membrane protein YphA (DoxX/SURF4 family)